jgi:hypothetical protein
LSKSGCRTCRPDGDKNEFVIGESTKETVKTIAQGMPGVSGVTVVTTLVCYQHTAHEAAGASGARHSLRPLNLEGGNFQQIFGRLRREIAKLCLQRCCLKIKYDG